MTSQDSENEVQVDEKRGCLLLFINRPHAGNSITLSTAQAMREVIAAAQERTDLRGIILAGAGGKFFCTGGDIKAYRSLHTRKDLSNTFEFIRDLLSAIEQHPLPIVAAIDGYALGGGAELALACDLRIGSPSAVIGFPQAKLGIIPGWNGVERLVSAVGRARAARLLLESAQISVDEAAQIGLLDMVAASGSAVDQALEYLTALPAAPLAVRAIKEAIRGCRPAFSSDATSAIFEKLWFSEDHREAESAFAEKRKPVFVGR